MKTLRERLISLNAEWVKTKDEYGRPDGMFDIGEIYYFACNFEEIAKQMDALLEECGEKLRLDYWHDDLRQKLKQQGYGNDAD